MDVVVSKRSHQKRCYLLGRYAIKFLSPWAGQGSQERLLSNNFNALFDFCSYLYFGVCQCQFTKV